MVEEKVNRLWIRSRRYRGGSAFSLPNVLSVDEAIFHDVTAKEFRQSAELLPISVVACHNSSVAPHRPPGLVGLFLSGDT
jgi:hypothetical protein